MNILITGGAGFIGSNFIRYWLKRHIDDRIVNIDKLTYAGNLNNLSDIHKDPRYSFFKVDICNSKKVTEILGKNDVDIVIHFAAQSHVDRSVMLETKNFDELELFKESLANDFVLNNVWGTHVLLEAVTKYWQSHGGMENKRFHYISTDEVFGALALDDTQKFNETTKYNPRSPYAASKAAADHLVRSYFTSFNLPITISNTSNNYGPYMYPEKLLPLAITNLIEGKKVPIYGDGKYVRDWLYVDDHCKGIELIITKGTLGETYCIGGLTDDVNNLQLIQRVLNIMNKDEKSNIEYVKDRPGHDRRYAVDWSKAHRELGYQPEYSMDEYLEKTVKWYQDNEWWWKPIKSGDRYKQYYEKQYNKR